MPAMHSITDVILAADRLATQAAEEALKQPPPVVDPAAVDAVLSSIPDAAAKAKRHDPEATTFTLTTWDPRDRAAAALYAAVGVKVREIGFTPAESDPGTLALTYSDLRAVADLEREHRANWLDEARKLWIQKAGTTATVVEKPDGDAVLLSFETTGQVAPVGDPLRSPFERFRWNDGVRFDVLVSSDWPQRTVAEVVEEVTAKLRPLSWTPEDLDKLWKEAGGFAVRPDRGMWTGGEYNRDASVTFLASDQSVTYLVGSVYTLTTEQLVGKAAEDLGLGTAKHGQRSGKQKGQGQTTGAAAQK